MGNSRVLNLVLNTICAALVLVLSFYKVNGQITTACTASMVTSFTPCLNFITGSSANGRTSPSEDCCDSVKSVMTDSVDCICLIITGNVPLSLPFNRTLAISLPQACNSGVPLRCKSSGAPLPAPGPVLFTPPQAPTSQAPVPGHAHAPGHSHARAPYIISPRASKEASSALVPAPPPVDDTTDPEITPASSPKASRSLPSGAHPGIRPVLNPAPSAASPSNYDSVPSLLLMLIATLVFQTLL